MAVEEEYHKRGTRGGAANKKRVWWELQEDVIDEVQQRFGFTPPKLQWEQGSEVQLAALRAWNRDVTEQRWEELHRWHQPTALRIRAIREEERRAAATGAAGADTVPATPSSPTPSTPPQQQQAAHPSVAQQSSPAEAWLSAPALPTARTAAHGAVAGTAPRRRTSTTSTRSVSRQVLRAVYSQVPIVLRSRSRSRTPTPIQEAAALGAAGESSSREPSGTRRTPRPTTSRSSRGRSRSVPSRTSPTDRPIVLAPRSSAYPTVRIDRTGTWTLQREQPSGAPRAFAGRARSRLPQFSDPHELPTDVWLLDLKLRERGGLSGRLLRRGYSAQHRRFAFRQSSIPGGWGIRSTVSSTYIAGPTSGPCYESHSKVWDAASGAGNSWSIFGKQSRTCFEQSKIFFASTLSSTASQKSFCPCKQPAWPTHQAQAAASIVEVATKRAGSSLWRSRPTLETTAKARATAASSTKAGKPRDPRSPTSDTPREPEDAQHRPGLARGARREHPLWGKASPTDRGRIGSSTDSSRSIQFDYLQLLWGRARANYGTGDRHSKGTLGLQGHLRWYNTVHALQGNLLHGWAAHILVDDNATICREARLTGAHAFRAYPSQGVQGTLDALIAIEQWLDQTDRATIQPARALTTADLLEEVRR